MNSTDATLLGAMLNGDEESFTELYRRHQLNIYRFALHMSGSPAAAEDVTQEVFLSLIEQGHNFDPERGAFSAFLFGIARNQVLRWLRSHKRIISLEALTESPLSNDDLLDEVTRSRDVERLKQMIVSLPARYREAVVLCDLHEMDYESAAHILSCSIGTVRSRLHRGRALLEAKLRAMEKSTQAAQGGRSYELPAL